MEPSLTDRQIACKSGNFSSPKTMKIAPPNSTTLAVLAQIVDGKKELDDGLPLRLPLEVQQSQRSMA